MLEQQFASGSNSVATPRVLLVSSGFSYTYDTRLAAGSRITAMALNGVAIGDAAVYRVTMNSFLATGGDNFTVFNQGTNALGGDLDVDALEAYLTSNAPVAPPTTNRITRAL